MNCYFFHFDQGQIHISSYNFIKIIYMNTVLKDLQKLQFYLFYRGSEHKKYFDI